MGIFWRSVTITLINDTNCKLELKHEKLNEGDWSDGQTPPLQIEKNNQVVWKSEQREYFGGTNGFVEYKINVGSENKEIKFYLSWDNPFFLENGYEYRIIGDCEGEFELLCSGGKGNDAIVDFHLTSPENKIRHLSSWMCKIKDGTSISHISIPGTHNSCAQYAPHNEYFRNKTICQDKSIEWQLYNGIRFLDIRCKAKDGIFAIHHSTVYQKINFGDVIDICISFLKENPSETILMRIKREDINYLEIINSDQKNKEINDKRNKEFLNIFNTHYKNYHQHMYLENAIPLIEYVRGKLVIISNVSTLKGIPWDNIKVQDNYKANDVKEKKGDIDKHINDAIRCHKDHNTLFINFINVQGGLLKSIGEFASELNLHLLNVIKEKRTGINYGLGIFPMDFPNHTNGLIKEIIELNFLHNK
ncbi:phosphatidylinositol-specific phospholipase C domain-containing protein [Photorhabdus laumondii subsp. laumondii]|uniref:1-phosphatidylinositol phosphodiesterase n=2 Tax=Photorhabdus TaxID=29487 RepID=A0A6L9JDJ0_PHOLM|nr:phosphatidylinositol-specific phospholipase C [Photorhabdus laumondii]KTL61589.1 hypothetical protein AA106_22830 [Photorhabdus laumondii subsp. laumondii]MCC8412521.1 phosphatidylinositol-specific phospholipase C [Photorhabdus laumondii]NDK92923.1 phosphatidylinositol-specific phospholipase C domain-containing protein [Photorhabdus laumondii subsp. laumondii]NDL19060.1 phosphatidylinositol-specific phospholipase C domain-containing protein [Photorhabdus laumondii subsp. laumondii]NDL28047.